MERVHKVYMVGIGGSGMSGIAEVLHNLGYEVSGSDLSDNTAVQHLRSLGISIAKGHSAENITDVHVLVKSTAVRDDNPEVEVARERGIPIIPRAEMLAELMRLRTGIAIAGTHGKTTTTSLTASIFEEAGLDPTVIIGGRLNAYGTNARLGTGRFLIAEADESDGSFLCLMPIMNVVTNVDMDHLDFYGDQGKIDQSFLDFMNKVPFYGINVICGDDVGIRRLMPQIKRPVLTYGFAKGNDLTAEIISLGARSVFKVFLKGCLLGEVNLAHPGKHNVLNALGAIAVSMQAQIPADVCIRGLSKFRGVGRRFDIKGERGGVVVIDDYAHHPVEIKATVATAKVAYPGRRLVGLFQPHRFSRTKALFGDFCKCFEGLDQVILTEIYPASEDPIPGVSGQSLAQGIKQVSKTAVSFFDSLDEAQLSLSDILQPGDVFITLGAGNVNKVGLKWLEDKQD